MGPPILRPVSVLTSWRHGLRAGVSTHAIASTEEDETVAGMRCGFDVTNFSTLFFYRQQSQVQSPSVVADFGLAEHAPPKACGSAFNHIDFCRSGEARKWAYAGRHGARERAWPS